MPKKPTILSSADEDTFLHAMRGVVPLHSDKITPKPAPYKRHYPQPEPLDEWVQFHEHDPLTNLTPEAQVAYHQSGIAHKTLRNLRKGQYNVDAILDLHGMTIENARIQLAHFLSEALRDTARVVLIIHGKGQNSQGPILKNKLNQWLRTLDIVLAFCTAAQKHGGSGAMYVYLKRLKEENLLG